jgi:hypothetical protein
MPRIKIKDLPRDKKISKEEMKMVMGGYSKTILLNKSYPRDYLALDPENLIAGYNASYFSLRKAVLD